MSRREGDPGGGSFSVRQWDGLAHADFFAESVCGSYICGRSVHERESDRLQYPITFDFFSGRLDLEPGRGVSFIGHELLRRGASLFLRSHA